MSNLVGPNNKPIPTEEEKPAEDEAPKNGESGQSFQDLRVVPRGTLFYNLGLAIIDEYMTGMALQQMLMLKQTQKLVTDPPQLVAAKEQFAVHERRRFAMATELNNRFAEADRKYVDSLGLEVVDIAVPEGSNMEDEDAPSN